MTDRPEGIRGLADRLCRDVESVHDDLQDLVEYDVVRFQRDGRAERPFVPYDTIGVSLESTADDAAPAWIRTGTGSRTGVQG